MQDYCVEHGKMRAGFEISFSSVSAPPPVEEKKGPLGKVVTVLQAKYKSKTTVEVQVEVEGVEGTSWHARSKLSNKHNKKMLEDYLALKPLEAYVAPSTSKPAPQMDPQYASPSVVAAAAPPPCYCPTRRCCPTRPPASSRSCLLRSCYCCPPRFCFLRSCASWFRIYWM